MYIREMLFLSPLMPRPLTHRTDIDDELCTLISHCLVSSPKLAEGQTGTLLDLIHTHLTEHITKGWGGKVTQ